MLYIFNNESPFCHSLVESFICHRAHVSTHTSEHGIFNILAVLSYPLQTLSTQQFWDVVPEHVQMIKSRHYSISGNKNDKYSTKRKDQVHEGRLDFEEDPFYKIKYRIFCILKPLLHV